MPENNQVSDKTKPEATGSSSTQPGSQAIDMNHTNVIVPHRISNHDKLVQTMVMVDGEWVNVNDTNDQKNVQEDMHKVNRVVTEAQKDIINAQNAADSAVKSADSAISASKVNSDAIAAQSSAIIEAKITLDSAATEIQRTASNAASDAASIRADVATVQSEVNTAKTANETEVKSIRDDLKMVNSSIATVKDHLGNVSSELDTYAKSAAAQEHDITIIRQKQGQFEVDYAGTKGDVNQIKANIKGLSENLKNSEGDVASLQVTAKKLQSSMSDAEGNISNLQVTAKSYDKIFEDHLGRISKVEQTASTLTNELSDEQGHLNRVEQTAQGTQQTVANQQGQINNIKTDVSGVHQALTGQGNQLANINVTLSGLNTKYEGVSGDLGKLSDKITTNSTQITQNKQAIALKADQSTVVNLSGEVNQNKAQLKVQADQISSKVSSDDFKTLDNKVGGAITQIQKNSTAIDQTNQQISLKADQTEVDQIKNIASQNSSRLDVMAGEIKSKVTSTDVNNIVDSKGYTTTSTVQSLITQKAGTINESITNLTNSFNSLQVGGRNYLRDSDKSITGWGQDLGTIPNEVLNELAGKTITVSCDVEWSGYAHDNSRQNRLGFEASVTGSDGHGYWLGAWKTPTTASGKERISTQYTLPAGVTFTVNNNGQNGYVSINGSGKVSHVKIEVGTKATDWTPASEDMATVTQVQSLTASIDGLQSTVASKADRSQITQLSNVIQSKVSSTDFNNLRKAVDLQTLESADANNLKTNGHYFVHNLANNPVGGWVYVDVTGNGNDRIRQDVYQDSGNKHKYRRWFGNSWTNWSEGATESEITQLRDDINLRVKSGDLLSQINIEAGRTLIQSNKIYFDADSFVMSPNSKAFIPSAFITNLSADKITTGTLDASKLHVKNFSANDIEAGTLSGVTIKAGDTDFFQTSQDNIYWITNNGRQSALIGRGEYVTFPGLNIFDSHAIYLGTWAGADLENGTIKDTGGSLGHPKFNIELPADSAFDLFSKNGEMGSTMVPLDNSRISGWVDQHEFFYLKQTQGFHTELNPDLNTSQFRIQKNDHIGAYFGEGNNGNQITFNFGGNDGGLNVNGQLHVTGSKNSIVETRQGYLAINAYETAEYYFGDIGENNTGDTSQVVIGIDRIFNEVVNTDIQYQVFVTPYSNAHVWVEKRYNNRFIVKSDRPNAEFGWELKAKRKGYESNRLRRVNVDFNQMDLKGEN